ncbi:MAG: uncharacterized protein KVP18_000562 [Porospora cf. gigantea A]|uniref:uncharacterized protein n=1 Tax=Porospora cf. gigantea A TaxID=2853593 RepID=UPI00355A04BF|nr:MAG: hypothetical protein KVP18_000562 [Porospora cf. gigantea A]
MSLTLHTSLGDLKLELELDKAPHTCKNFLALCASGYYDNTAFHRNIAGFAVQGGDPTGTGRGGESVSGDYFEDEIHPAANHDRRGVLSMANQNKPCTNGSQFFLLYSRQPQLNGRFTVFGRLIDGWRTLDKMEKVPVGEKHRPLEDVTILSVTIHANPLADLDVY